MASRALSQNAFLEPDHEKRAGAKAKEQAKESGNAGIEPKKSHRRATVYDAVAGRINSAGFIPKQLVYASTRDTTSTSTAAVSPEAVLFRQKGAPTRYAESDIYFANERGLKTELPDSDLLKALHCYASDFYSRATRHRGAGNWRSMDETALLALGILLEEATHDILGQTGDLVFTEGEEVRRSSTASRRTSRSKRSPSRRPSKKRRVEDSNDVAQS